ncbi:MAG: type II toxin-antitoxin system VapC family toxin [Chloroflexota bacterium]|nr:type II toxin-antitoxin system VapC family toxin [Chloroflexota bacterium]
MFYYLDSSVLAKRYLNERGTAWVQRIADPASGHRIVSAAITEVETAAAICARHRNRDPRLHISLTHRDQLLQQFRRHVRYQYVVITINDLVLKHAANLVTNYRLRGYDAVQLAAALAANVQLVQAAGSSPMFAAGDNDLRAAAQGEGLSVVDPNLMP